MMPLERQAPSYTNPAWPPIRASRRVPAPIIAPRPGYHPARGVVVFERGAMSRRGILRVYRPRSARHRRAQSRHDRFTRHREEKRAIKHATMRDCGRRCVYCAQPLALDSATLDHVHPIARGGSHALGNLVAACERCNRMKGDMLPSEFFARFPWAGLNFMRYARAVHRALKRGAKRAVSLAYAADAAA